jgi:hypothetical protein
VPFFLGFRHNTVLINDRFRPFEIFSFQLKEGTGDQALRDPGAVVLSESKAKKYFNGESALDRPCSTKIRR